MTKDKKGSRENPINEEDLKALEEATKPLYIIIEAKINDGVCNYNYRVNKGTHVGDVQKVTPTGIAMPDLHAAFSKLNVHLAILDDVFKHKGIEIENPDDFHTEEITYDYNVTGFKIKGDTDDESVILIGSKHTSNGMFELESPKVAVDNISSYKWYNELKESLDNVRNEVALYKEGKFETPIADKPKKFKQLSITENTDSDELDNDFDENKVD